MGLANNGRSSLHPDVALLTGHGIADLSQEVGDSYVDRRSERDKG
jgi:hypothetical protein